MKNLKAILYVFISMIVVLILSSCSKTAGDKEKSISENQKTYTLDELKAAQDDLAIKLNQLETKVNILQYNNFQTASFDPGNSKGYARLDANVGTFLVTLKNVQPYLDGQKVTLLIGNPNNISFSGFKLKIKWGHRMPDIKLPPNDFSKAWQDYQNSMKEKEEAFTDVLRPGVWNQVSFNITPAPANAFGELDVSMTTDQVLLYGGR